MDDDADLLASLIDDQDSADENSIPSASCISLTPNAGKSCSSKQEDVDTMKERMAQMQKQIMMLQSQLESKSSDTDAKVQTASPKRHAVRGSQHNPVASSSSGPPPASETLFNKNQYRTARAGQSAQAPQAQACRTSQSADTQRRPASKPALHASKAVASPKNSPVAAQSSAGNKSVKEAFSGLHLINPIISSSAMAQRMEGRRMVRVSRLASEKLGESQLGDNWVTIGVLIKKNVKQSAKGSSYSIWTLSDLSSSSSNVSLFLFGKAHSEHWKVSECTVLAVLTPAAMDNRTGADTGFKVHEAEKMMILGQSRDAGYCKSVTKAGNKCRSIIDKSSCEFCEYHVQAEYRRVSAKRMECQGTSQRPQNKSIMERVIGRNNRVSYGGHSYGVPSRTARDLQGMKTSGPLAKRGLHNMAVPNSAADLKQLDTTRQNKAPSAVTRATGQVMCSSSVVPTSQKFQQLLEADSPGSRLLRGAQRQQTGATDCGPIVGGSDGGAFRTARDMLVDEDKEHGHIRTGLGNLPCQAVPRAKVKKTATQQQIPSSRPELVCSTGASSKRILQQGGSDSCSAASFSDALSSGQPKAGSKRKSNGSSVSGDRKRASRASSNTSAAFDEHADVPTGGESFCDDEMVLDDAFGDHDSLQRYIKTPVVKTCSSASNQSSNTSMPSTCMLGRGSVGDNVDLPPSLSASSVVALPKPNDIQTKRQDDAMQRAVLAVRKSGGLVCDNPNTVPGRRKAVESPARGDSTRTKERTANNASATPQAAVTSKKSRLSSLVEISESDAQRVTKAQSSHYDEAKILELEHQERYFNKLERKEDMENKMKTVMEIKVKIVQCKECSYTAESASRRCSSEHKEKLVWSQTMKRFFECEGCKQRESTYAGAWPTTVCKCGLSNYRRVSMFKERSYKAPEFEWNSSSLLIRGPEQSKFING